jgi:chemosensory pili system protein ChpC
VPETSSRSRVVLLQALAERLEAGVFGIVSQGFPQLVRVSRDVIRSDPAYAVPANDPVLCRVRMLNEMPRIPDLDRLEALIADETSVSAA